MSTARLRSAFEQQADAHEKVKRKIILFVYTYTNDDNRGSNRWTMQYRPNTDSEMYRRHSPIGSQTHRKNCIFTCMCVPELHSGESFVFVVFCCMLGSLLPHTVVVESYL